MTNNEDNLYNVRYGVISMLRTVDHFSGSLDNIGFVCIEAMHKGKWVLCLHKRRKTWECPGGHVESGELPLTAAKRELYEETGAIDFDIIPVWDYEAFDENNVRHNNGRVYFAIIRAFEGLKEDNEMEKIDFFEDLPYNVTYDRTQMIDMLLRAKKYSTAYYE